MLKMEISSVELSATFGTLFNCNLFVVNFVMDKKMGSIDKIRALTLSSFQIIGMTSGVNKVWETRAAAGIHHDGTCCNSMLQQNVREKRARA